jgi:hypothetical protein
MSEPLVFVYFATYNYVIQPVNETLQERGKRWGRAKGGELVNILYY